MVIDEFESQKYLNLDMKKIGAELLKKYKIANSQANGVIFIEDLNKTLKIHPIVWVKSIDTLFYETACGSGSIAVGIVQSFLCDENKVISLLQPSGKYIDIQCEIENDSFKVRMAGIVDKKTKLKKIIIE